MASATITNPSQGTYDLYNNDQVVRAIIGANDWLRYKSRSQFFATMMATGNYSFTGNTELNVILGTGLVRDFTSLTTINTATVTSLDATTDLGLAAGILQINDILTFDGSIAMIRITDISGTTLTVTVEQADGSVTARNGSIINSSEMDGSAPVSQNLQPTNTQQWMQMFRHSYGKGLVSKSQDTIFNNSMEYLLQEGMDKLMQQMNNAIQYQAKGRNVASGNDTALLRGLPYWLDLAGAGTFSAAEDQALNTVDTGTTFSLNSMREWADQFVIGMEKIFFMSPGTLTKYNNAVQYRGSDVIYRQSNLEDPAWRNDNTIIDLGNIVGRVVVDRNMARQAHKFIAGGNTAAKNNYFLAIDPDYCKIAYHQNEEMGTMIPRVFTVDNTRNLHKDERELKTCFSLAMSKLSGHGAYGITNT